MKSEYDFTHKGIKVEFVQDECAESPDTVGDPSLFLVGFHRDFTVERDGFKLKHCRAYAEGDKDGYDVEEFKKYHIFGLEAYIHSGVVLALSREGNFCDRNWDVSQLGLVFVSKKEWRMRKSAIKIARSLIEGWNMYLEGDVWMFRVEGEDAWNCGYGYDAMVKDAKMEAEAVYQHRLSAHIQKKKAEIKHHAPLEARTEFGV